MKTESETFFEKLCKDKRIKFEPIPVEKNLRTPDYHLWLDTIKIIVEVKQMEPNKDDLEFLEKVRKGIEVPNGFRSTGHLRIRNIIDDAYSQLKNFTNDIYPSLIIACDLTKGVSHLNSEDILNAMYGNETVIDNDLSMDEEEVEPARHKFGRDRKLTKNTKRFLSALALLKINEINEEITLSVFHNIHAKVPLDYKIAWQIADKQYTLQNGSELYQPWSEIVR